MERFSAGHVHVSRPLRIGGEPVSEKHQVVRYEQSRPRTSGPDAIADPRLPAPGSRLAMRSSLDAVTLRQSLFTQGWMLAGPALLSARAA